MTETLAANENGVLNNTHENWCHNSTQTVKEQRQPVGGFTLTWKLEKSYDVEVHTDWKVSLSPKYERDTLLKAVKFASLSREQNFLDLFGVSSLS